MSTAVPSWLSNAANQAAARHAAEAKAAAEKEAAMAATASRRLKDRIAIVTGGSSGIGRAISLAYAAEGAKVLVGDLQPKARLAAEQELATHELIVERGGEAAFATCDVTDWKSVDALVEEAVSRWGRLDIMVNNAGVALDTGTPKPVWETTNDNWDKTMAINLNGVYYGVRAASRQMVKQDALSSGDRGWIINTASILALVGTPAATAYVASKHAVLGLTKTAALDLAPLRVHCNAICPGYVDSNLTTSVFADSATKTMLEQLHPFRGVGVPQDISRIAVFLASDDARWVTGTGLVVDGGFTAQ